MFSKLFNSFKKKPDYDPLRVTIHDLAPKFIIEYDLRDWEVIETYQYDWGDNEYSKEHKISDGKDIRFLSVEEDDTLELVLSEKVSDPVTKNMLIGYYKQHDTLPSSIELEGKTFVLVESSPGYFGEGIKPKNWIEFMNYDYVCQSDKNTLLSIEQFDNAEFELSIGHYLKEYEIANITPA